MTTQFNKIIITPRFKCVVITCKWLINERQFIWLEKEYSILQKGSIDDFIGYIKAKLNLTDAEIGQLCDTPKELSASSASNNH